MGIQQTLWPAGGDHWDEERKEQQAEALAKANRDQITTSDKQLDFIMGGRATFTVLNRETGNRLTFKVKRKETDKGTLYFVGVLSGPDNTSDYTYLGTIFPDGSFRQTKGSQVGPGAVSYKGFKFIWERLRTGWELPEQVEFWHEGRCCKCGRVLTVPESIERGMGPECAGKA